MPTSTNTETTHQSKWPPFPANIPTHPLLIIDYALLEKGDEEEAGRLWEAATRLGFWYLKNHGGDEWVDGMFDLGEEMMSLSLEEKMRYEQGEGGVSFGYKAAGANAVNAAGDPDTVEFINIARDDALAYPTIARRSYPPVVNARMESTVRGFVKRAMEVNETILRALERKLGLGEGILVGMHRREAGLSGSEARVIKCGVREGGPKPGEDIAIGGHTDFGSLSFLCNRLGGLQVRVPGREGWEYVKPLEGHAICNVGDALAIMSAGVLRSNLHRVVPPPGNQGAFVRWSLVYFMRPANHIVLRPLVDESPIIAAAVSNASEEIKAKWTTNSTAQEWFERRVRNQRLKNRKGPETWLASRGTEVGN